jgi:AraC-like DNA-binding protein
MDMHGPRPTVSRLPGGTYATSPDLLPGAVVSTVGYASVDQTPTLHRGLPSPYLTVIFSLDGPIVSGATAEEALGSTAARNHLLVAGLHTAPTYVVQPATQSGIQLAVHPLAARQLLGAPSARVPWEATEGAELLGPQVARVHQRLAELTSWQAQFDLLAGYLRERADRRAAEVRPELREAWSWLARRHGAGSMDDLSRHVSLSPRQLRAVFRAELGSGPKQVARLMRFDAAKRSLAAAVLRDARTSSPSATERPLGLTDIAVRCGYYDHSHLDAEFRSLAGVSPTGWVAEEHRNIQVGGHRSEPEWAHDIAELP